MNGHINPNMRITVEPSSSAQGFSMNIMWGEDVGGAAAPTASANGGGGDGGGYAPAVAAPAMSAAAPVAAQAPAAGTGGGGGGRARHKPFLSVLYFKVQRSRPHSEPPIIPPEDAQLKRP
jgi:hypothetical protein